MALSLRHIRRRIKSVENTKKMTRAMEMVAAAKLKKLQDLLKQSDHYIAELRRILGTLVQEKPLAHPLLEKRAEIKNVLAFVIASDAGLCGSYNTNIMEKANEFILSTTSSPLVGEDKGGGLAPHPNLPPQRGEGTAEIHFVTIGKQAANFLRRKRFTITKEFTIPRPQEIDKTIQDVTAIATNEFQTEQADRVVFIYTKVFSLGSLKPMVDQLFPFVSPMVPVLAGTGVIPERRTRTGTESPVDYIIEPSLEDILNVIIPEFIEAQVGQFIKHSLVAEQVSRMLAMRLATDNASEMVESLTLLRNKARQASITKELIEVVSGSRALQMK